MQKLRYRMRFNWLKCICRKKKAAIGIDSPNGRTGEDDNFLKTFPNDRVNPPLHNDDNDLSIYLRFESENTNKRFNNNTTYHNNAFNVHDIDFVF